MKKVVFIFSKASGFIQTFFVIISLLLISYSLAENSPEDEISYWLNKAEQHAYNIKDPNERDTNLFHLAITHVDAKNYEKAYSLVSEINKSERKMYWGIVLKWQAKTGDIKGALHKIQTFKDKDIKSHCSYSVISECIEKNRGCPNRSWKYDSYSQVSS